MIDPVHVAAVLGVVLIASAVQSLLGFGFALVAVPLLMGTLGVRDGVVLVTLGGIVNTVLVAHHAREDVPVCRVAGLLAGCLAGLPVGLAALLRRRSTSMNGPPVVLDLQALRTPPAEFRGALAVFFTITSRSRSPRSSPPASRRGGRSSWLWWCSRRSPRATPSGAPGSHSSTRGASGASSWHSSS
jgi:uncharacterized membrane protein YfcA